MIKIGREKSVLKMSPKNIPVAHASPGDTIVFETFDCFSNEIVREDQLFGSVGWDRINPATGPLYIEGARPGDILKIEILDIKLDSQGVMTTAPDHGALGQIIDQEKTRIISILDGKAKFNHRLELDVKPMIGVIGTAPRETEIPTGTPGTHGGNMDCKRIGIGAVVYLPVNVPGALLAMGDVHALMGDGEVIVCGIEIAAEITITVDVLTGVRLPLPMVVEGEHVMTIASEATLDEAAVTATEMMFDFIRHALHIDIHEAGMLLSIAGNLRICQIVDPLMTARMEFPLWILEKYGYSMN